MWGDEQGQKLQQSGFSVYGVHVGQGMPADSLRHMLHTYLYLHKGMQAQLARQQPHRHCTCLGVQQCKGVPTLAWMAATSALLTPPPPPPAAAPRPAAPRPPPPGASAGRGRGGGRGREATCLAQELYALVRLTSPVGYRNRRAIKWLRSR